jgi:DNA replication protein DnaC
MTAQAIGNERRGSVTSEQFKGKLAAFLADWTEDFYRCTMCGTEDKLMRRNDLLGEPFVCWDCTEAKEAEQKTRWERMAEWTKQCPKAYRESDWKQLPCRHLINEVQAWEWQKRGVVFAGSPGVGKTRLAYIMLKRLHAEGKRVRAMTATDFALGVQEQGGKHKLPEWLKDLCGVSVLLLDDLGKEKLSESVVAQLFHVLDKRMAEELPVLITTNYKGQHFIERFGEYGEPLYRRLKEACIIMPVTAQEERMAA